ncbi:hypothetical protein [Olivibacter sitiensis]|uniref:hypothetical protein n=1 Tax=Olivibacter sitiensis TaxID=376470 RepID=UPI00042A8235|nr:hypothetical protein [Olivibacter sitiensis]
MFRKIAGLVVLCLYAGSLVATPTKLIVRVKAKDAKFMGTGIGGASVVIKDNLTGELLAKGVTTGSSGDTKLLLQTLLARGHALTDEKTAKFEATLDIKEPTLLDVEVLAPLSRKGAAIKGTTQFWLIPGKDIVGDGLIIELSGLILDILSPTTHQFIPLSSLEGKALNFKVSLTMLCGCVISKGGIWDSDDIEIKAVLKKEGVEIGQYDLRKLSEDNLYDGDIDISEKGNYELLVYAFYAKGNNTGVDKINFVIQ